MDEVYVKVHLSPQVKGSTKSIVINSREYGKHFIEVEIREKQPILTENNLILRANSQGPTVIIFTMRFLACHSKGQPPG